MDRQAPQRQVFSVSELNREVKQLLEGSIPLLWVSGEISNFARPSSGHWYFTLKDSRAQVRCAMFRGRNMAVRFAPQNGREVLIRARVSLYEGRGEYQLIAEHMEEAGHGALQRELELRMAKLRAEGLFAQERKRPLPQLPMRIGVITSPTGAAVRDIIHVLGRRCPAAEIGIWPVAVQGQEAAPQIAAAIQRAAASGRHDLLIVGRGGGSLEDLWPFNEEIVARALAACPIPTISAVGHETDTTIADFVADVRAPTPSAAAEIASANAAGLSEQLQDVTERMARSILNTLRHHAERLRGIRNALRHPSDRINSAAQRLDQLELRLRRAANQRIATGQHKLAQARGVLHAHNPGIRLAAAQRQLSSSRDRLATAIRHLLKLRTGKLERSAQLLHSVSPLAVLGRGYSIVLDSNNSVVTDAAQVSTGDRIRARVARGEIEAEVVGTGTAAAGPEQK
ncbi:exodeoxyribonuclease VII large subunit [Biformimicrobium ophioploci]|uniref:Exodeoxyribonuclease 7 large subunit n=1 Tax=Biformimicrobium ophioploci TaxID=3036711 RepID=A0ABQ6M2K3_9GAMM|nr:exodeoxyribonuclease VII large subunit [Microbulbifer sp. NKW57]GMG88519.1 exodeoxyribonuclease VII large subunit [Microbulbifer sp. NKW57]